jgi:TPR repeat protein
VGHCYWYGEGVEVDEEKAVNWLRKSADQEDGDAAILLGLCYETGRGVKQNYSNAMRWYLKAAEEHLDTEAMLRIARFYDLGLGVDEDLEEREAWVQKAKDQEGNEEIDRQLAKLNKEMSELHELEMSETTDTIIGWMIPALVIIVLLAIAYLAP